jgi:hypothetical protein
MGIAMKIQLVVGMTATALVLAACGNQTEPVGESSESSVTTTSAAASSEFSTSSSAVSTSATSTPAAAGPATAPAKGERPNRDFVVGKWGTDGDCMMAIDLRPDGTSDGPFGNWTYSDGVIGFVEEPDFKVSVTVLDPDTMESTNESGKKSKMTRCP